ncbi:ABC transporter ATP-binding protein [Listeria monocytogenes]|uniref:ABC transporter ATP-binding protein n=1 Tax=Listeria monocytogenes TaxID=1639 RepID=UPI000875709F|nr:ABC transporter ATP-binding protein [Listeria monocytogenes]EAC7182553.1 ABC transporter ATP-binding protein [Listeria monocytogenes]EAC8000827.1 ABC transporter ATP-binding protein [Listeria monocytogenes]EAC8350985.1 ABC transporter ATP-binding protein [Listeria monocytogenes]EAD0740702.1 ABC transporter ATP-binding protein [Listeria monocytogenes]EAD4096258.1 ABC transporter ATP-binding protein [Listeria monocytogenes]
MDKALVVNNIKKKYGDFFAVKGVTFDIGKEECVAFLGTNGAGKSSTLRMVYGASLITEGSIMINNLDISKKKKESKKIIGIVSQEDLLDLSLNVFENLVAHGICYDIPRREVEKRAISLLKFIELEEQKNKEIYELSGGMRRRVVLARSLINNPKLIILDEPTTGLDIQSRHLIWNKLLELKSKGVAILLTSHYMDEVEKIADRILIMHKGELISSGTKEELLKSYGEKNLEDVFLSVTNREGVSYV